MRNLKHPPHKTTTNPHLYSNFTPKPFSNSHPTLPVKPKPFSSSPTKITLCQPDSDDRRQSENRNPFFRLLRSVPDWADRVQERGMRQRRKLYDHSNWVHHRSSLRHLRHVASSLSSRVILSLVPPVLAFTSFAAAIAAYNSAVAAHFLLPEFLPPLRASSLPYQLTAPALALLLVFRTEASYSRFEEGRKAWTKVISAVNDFARIVVSGVGASSHSDAPIEAALLRYIVAFPVALKCHVTYGSDVGRDLEGVIDSDDLAAVVGSSHRPRCIMQFISRSLQMLDLDESKRATMEAKMSSFHEGIGVCEQLIGTPIPLSYTRLTSRFLVLWHLTLPIILWDDCHWIVVPATFMSAASLFCIEEVGVLIEEPFPMLALDDICELVKKNVEEALASEDRIRTLLDAKRNKGVTQFVSTNGHPKFKKV